MKYSVWEWGQIVAMMQAVARDMDGRTGKRQSEGPHSVENGTPLWALA